jgi:hypothetical protein
MANSPQPEGGEAQAKSKKLSGVIFSTRDVRYLRNDDFSNLLRRIAAENIDVLGHLGWAEYFAEHDGLSRAIRDPEGTLYLALIEDDGTTRRPVAHCKIVPPDSKTVTEGMAEAYFKKSAEQLIDPTMAMSAFSILSGYPENEEDITETDGVYGINPSKKGWELIQLFGRQLKARPELGLVILVFLDAVSKFSKKKDKTKQLKTPSFPMVQNPSQERTEAIEQGEKDIIRVFEEDIDLIYTTTWSPSIPSLFIKGLNLAFALHSEFEGYGLESYMNEMIQKENRYKRFKKEPLKNQQLRFEILKHQKDPVAFAMSINAMNKQGHYEVLDPIKSSKWEAHTLRRWREIHTLWKMHMKQNSKNPTEAHEAFIEKVSKQLSGFSEVAKATGLDLLGLGPNCLDLNLDRNHPNPLGSVQTAVLQPFTSRIPSPTDPFLHHDLAAVMGTRMRGYLSALGLNVSEIPLLNASGKEIFPTGYMQDYCEKQTAEAALIEHDLSASAEAVMALADKEREENPNLPVPTISPYRSLMPNRRIYEYYVEMLRRMQVPNSNNPNGHNDGR